jgi:exonuclease SbcD
MKILHTSDWHLGHRLHEHSQYEEQKRFLSWLKQYIDTQSVDVLLVAGDIFDTGVPSSQSLKLYYDFLIDLRSTSCRELVITGGNHDAPGTLNAPKTLLEALSVHVIGKATEEITDELIDIEVNGEKLCVAAVPFLRDRDIRHAIAGESFDQIELRYKTALINHYRLIAEHCLQRKEKGVPAIAMGHLFAIDAHTSDSEIGIYVGNTGHIGVRDFPEVFDYIALGHLHRPQIVGNMQHIRYSGSPYVLSFSEIKYAKNIIEIQIEKNVIKKISNIEIPNFRTLTRIGGNFEECTRQLSLLSKQEYELPVWVELVLDANSPQSYAEIQDFVKEMPLEVLKVSLDKPRDQQGIENALQKTKSVKEIKPEEVFKMKCEEEEFDLNAQPEILDAYEEILREIRDEEKFI